MMALTRKLAWAAATDAGNRSMRKHRRRAWNEDDYNAVDVTVRVSVGCSA